MTATASPPPCLLRHRGTSEEPVPGLCLATITTKAAGMSLKDVTACASPDSVLQPHRAGSEDAETASSDFELVGYRSPQEEPATPASTSASEPLLRDNPERFCLLPVE
jgi:hypothetical protein